MIVSILEGLFWISLFAIVYSYIIYPVILFLYASLWQWASDCKLVLSGESRRVDACKEFMPSVTVVISAYNEESCIAERIENLLSMEYPEGKLRFLIGSDGSADRTVEIARQYSDPRLEVIGFEINRGKASVLNDLASRATSDLLFFSDANTQFSRDAIQKAVRHFSDASVGAVCGELKLVAKNTRENRDGVYWKYERLLKFFESRVGGLLGANGAIYAIRRSLYQPIPGDTIVDDFVIAMNVALQGGRLIYDPEAFATEEVAPSAADEFGRRVRIGSGNYQVLYRFATLLNPRRGTLFFTYISHKVLRWLTPFFMLTIFLCSLILSMTSLLYASLLFSQIIIYFYSYIKRNSVTLNRLLGFMVFFIYMNVALGCGAIKYFRGKAGGAWKSTQR